MYSSRQKLTICSTIYESNIFPSQLLAKKCHDKRAFLGQKLEIGNLAFVEKNYKFQKQVCNAIVFEGTKEMSLLVRKTLDMA